SSDDARVLPVLRDARLRRPRRPYQHGLRHERHGSQHLLGHGAFPPDLWRHRRDHVFRDRLRNLAAPDWAATRILFALALAALALVHRHDGDDAALALAWPARPVASRRQFQLRQSHHCQLGTAGDRIARRRRAVARFSIAIYPQSRGPASQCATRADRAALCARRRSTPTRSRRAQWFWALERAGADEHAAGLRLSDRAIREGPVTLGDCSPNRLGGARDGLA